MVDFTVNRISQKRQRPTKYEVVYYAKHSPTEIFRIEKLGWGKFKKHYKKTTVYSFIGKQH